MTRPRPFFELKVTVLHPIVCSWTLLAVSFPLTHAHTHVRAQESIEKAASPLGPMAVARGRARKGELIFEFTKWLQQEIQQRLAYGWWETLRASQFHFSYNSGLHWLLEFLKKERRKGDKQLKYGIKNESRLMSKPDNGSGFLQQYWFALGKQVRRK